MSSEFLNVLASGVFAPKPNKPVAWVSENGVRFHVETDLSAASGKQEFVALCGATGDFFYLRSGLQNFLRCAECVRLSSAANIFDEVASQGRSTVEPKESITVGDSGEVLVSLSASSLPVPLTGREGVMDCGKLPLGAEAAGMSAFEPQIITSPLSNEHSADSRSLPRSSAQGKTGAGLHTSEHPAPWYFSCVRRGIEGFIADVDRVVDRETAEYQGVE